MSQPITSTANVPEAVFRLPNQPELHPPASEHDAEREDRVAQAMADALRHTGGSQPVNPELTFASMEQRPEELKLDEEHAPNPDFWGQEVTVTDTVPQLRDDARGLAQSAESYSRTPEHVAAGEIHKYVDAAGKIIVLTRADVALAA